MLKYYNIDDMNEGMIPISLNCRSIPTEISYNNGKIKTHKIFYRIFHGGNKTIHKRGYM